MGRPKKIENLFRPDQSKSSKAAKQGAAGYDNIRENIDPHIKTKVITSKEGQYDKVSVGANITDIPYNVKLYVYQDDPAISRTMQFSGVDNSEFWIVANGVDSYARIAFQNDAGDLYRVGIRGDADVADSFLITAKNSSNDWIKPLTITRDGKIGINQNEPERFLHIGDTTDAVNTFLTIETANNKVGGWLFNDGADAGRIQYDHANDYMNFYSNSLERLRIISDGAFEFQGAGGLTMAELYIADNSTAQTIPTGATYTKLTGTMTNGESKNCTADGTNAKITVTKVGKYLVNCHFNGSVDTANTRVDGAIFLDGTIQSNCQCKAEFVAADKNCSSNITGVIDVDSVNEDIDIRVKHDDGGNVDLTVVDANINVVQIGGT